RTWLAAPVVSGIAAGLLALNPALTPDRVKGALMLGAQALPRARSFSAGVGEVSAPGSASIRFAPNPILALDHFLVPDPFGQGVVFDDQAWKQAVAESPAWNS